MDFSALNLRVTSTGDKEVLSSLGRIDARVQAMSATSKAAFDRLSEDQKRAFLKVSGAAEAGAATVAQGLEQMGERGARATQGVARGLEMVSRTGKLTGRSLDAVLSNVSGLAMGFGTGGILLGTIGIATASIVELFMRTRRELEKTQIEFNQRLDAMAKAGNLAGIAGRFGEASQMFSGDPFASVLGKNPGESSLDYLKRSQGIVGLRKRQAELQSFLSNLGSGDATRSRAQGISGWRSELQDLNKVLADSEEKHKRLLDVMKLVTATKVDETDAALRNERHPESPTQRIAWFQPGGYQKPGVELDETRLWQQQLDARKEYAIKSGADLQQIELEFWRARLFTVREGSNDYVEALSHMVAAETALAKQADADWKHLVEESNKSIQDAIAGRGQQSSAPKSRNEMLIAAFSSGLTEEAKAQIHAIGQTLGNAFTAGIESAFSTGGNLKSMFRTMTGRLLEGMGDMMIQYGEGSAAFFELMMHIQEAIFGGDPEIGLAASLALIAAGAALKGLGSSIAAGGHGSGGGGGSSYGSSYAPIVNTSYVSPNVPNGGASASSIGTRPSVTNVNYIIGPADPQAQRMWSELQRASTERGSL